MEIDEKNAFFTKGVLFFGGGKWYTLPMTVYIEYAFLENFLLDGVLLFLSQIVARLPVRWGRLCFAAAVGAAFAVVYPLLILPRFLAAICRLSVGLLLPLLAVGRLNSRAEWRRYARSALVFFGVTFLFGGALTFLCEQLSYTQLPPWSILLGFALLTVGGILLAKRWYARRAVTRYLYDCTVIFGEKRVQVTAFFDTGNLAAQRGRPVCFLTADIFYDLFESDLLFEGKEGGQVRDETAITTLTGEKKLPVYLGDLQISVGGKLCRINKVYFARWTNRISREYKMILNGRIFER